MINKLKLNLEYFLFNFLFFLNYKNKNNSFGDCLFVIWDL